MLFASIFCAYRRRRKLVMRTLLRSPHIKRAGRKTPKSIFLVLRVCQWWPGGCSEPQTYHICIVMRYFEVRCLYVVYYVPGSLHQEVNGFHLIRGVFKNT
jgi:hypothetical protein